MLEIRLETNKYGDITGYYCQCSFYNDILTIYCKNCSVNNNIPEPLRLKAIYRRDIILHYMDNEKRVELHSQFFNNPNQEGMLLGYDIISAQYDKLCEWEETLEKVIVEAKAKTQRIGQEKRERQNKMSKEDRDKLITRPDMTVTEGLLAPRVRKDRQSQADKLVSDMANNLGIPMDMINQLMSQNITPSKSGIMETPGIKPDSKIVAPVKTNEAMHLKGVTQEILLSEILSTVNLESTNLAELEHKMETAALIIPKTESKLPPDMFNKLVTRVYEVRAIEKEKNKVKEEKVEIPNFSFEEKKEEKQESSISGLDLSFLK